MVGVKIADISWYTNSLNLSKNNEFKAKKDTNNNYLYQVSGYPKI